MQRLKAELGPSSCLQDEDEIWDEVWFYIYVYTYLHCWEQPTPGWLFASSDGESVVQLTVLSAYMPSGFQIAVSVSKAITNSIAQQPHINKSVSV